MIVKWRTLFAGLPVLAACATGPSMDPPADEPGGWIYLSPSLTLYAAPARVDVRTGAIETLAFPPPFDPAPNYFFHEGLVSPVDGDLTGDAKVDGLFYPTFVRDSRTGAVTVYRDAEGGPTALALDNGHEWAPDGSLIAFSRHQAQGCCKAFLLLDPSTGVQDTLETFAGQVPSDYTWFGPDTLLWLGAAGYRTYALATGDTAAWNLVPYYPFKMPTISSNRQWIAHWMTADSVANGNSAGRFNHLKLFDRQRSADTTLLISSDSGDGALLSEAFDPDSRYLAYCAGQTSIRILRLATGKMIKELAVPFCWSLNWSWGPEGRSPDLGG